MCVLMLVYPADLENRVPKILQNHTELLGIQRRGTASYACLGKQ